MARVQQGRYTASVDGEAVLFLIGMRVNKPWKVHRWAPVLSAMGPMLRELMAHPELGLLSAHAAVKATGPMVVQYWRSFEDLERFARDRDAPHLPAWRRFNQRIGTSGDVGVWHETYRIAPGSYETVYSNMPVVGLAAATASVPVGGRRDSARARWEGTPAGPVS